MQHEFNYTDRFLAKRGLSRLNIDPRRVEIGWVMDLCAQALRNIVIGLGGKRDGFTMESRFDIAVSSEVMAILSVARDLADLRERIGKMVVAMDKRGRPVTTADIEVDGAMTAWMVEALKPNLLQTLEGQPCFVHAGPFANIAIGQSSILADKVGLKLSDYHVTESGFGTDVGFEKFWNLKCRLSGLTPHCAVLVTTIRGLKCHGGGPPVPPGKPLDPEYTKEHVDWVERGAENMIHHINIIKQSGINPVVCINAFTTDTPAEVDAVRRIAEEAGARVALSRHWEKGGEGALELADAVVEACEDDTDFRYLYEQESTIRHRIETIATKVYGADGVNFLPEAEAKLEKLEQDPQVVEMGVCMVKTQLSLSHDPAKKGVPKGWKLPVRDIVVYRGAGLVVPVAGKISLMPGTGSDPAFRRVDVDVETGKVKGLF
jgi:formate--tetrahydrofolate ligase